MTPSFRDGTNTTNAKVTTIDCSRPEAVIRYCAFLWQAGVFMSKVSKEEMIFALDETNTLWVFSSEAEIQREFEGVDVEEGIYRFFDDSGKPLIAEFIVPNRRGKGWVQSGTYRLLPTSDISMPHLSHLLSTVSGIYPNRYFPDLQAVRNVLPL